MPSLFTLPVSWLTTIKMYRDKISELVEKKWSTDYTLTHQPLLDTKDLLTLHASAADGINPLSSEKEVATLLVGERSSSYAGSGYEFAENQLFVAGDDSRFINWRMLAKTGKMYRKKFIEERRPELWVVVDKRASMRFGTQQHLKVTRAAMQAIYHLYLAQKQQLACAGVILDETVRWYKPSQDNNSLQTLIEDIIAPTPPLTNETIHDCFNLILRQLNTRATPGSIIVLLSDFHQLAADVPGSLYTLTKKHQVRGIHIVDPIELELPDTGNYQVTEQHDQQPWMMDCHSISTRQQYMDSAKQWQHDIEQQLIQSGVSYQLSK